MMAEEQVVEDEQMLFSAVLMAEEEGGEEGLENAEVAEMRGLRHAVTDVFAFNWT